ncbi:MAG: transglycosylase SLT domain-containing protein [bacterium]
MRTKHAAPTIAIVLFAAACAGHQSPGVLVPESASPAPASAIQQATAAATTSSTAATSSEPKRDSLDGVRVSATDVSRQAVEVFGALPPATKSVVASSDSSAPAPSWDIDVHSYESTDRVEHYVRLFTGPAKERVVSWLEKGSRYEPMIRTKMREGGLPEDMYYLALIESGFDQNAYSRAAAVGMWQFMTSTARDMGLRVDWWVDERRDPIKSTGAAVKFIKGLNEQFGSLYLAAAAYNGGPGRIARGLSRYADDFEGTTGDDLFFALAEKSYLRNETREYVPQLIAAALIAKEPDRYGMKLAPQAAFVYDSVRVGPSSPLAAIAHAAGATVSQEQELNPHVLRGITPPKDSFYVRVPVGAADSFAVAFAALPKSERVGLRTIESKKGESIASIARREGLNARQLSLYNPKIKALKSGNLAGGQTILVPTEAIASAATHAPDPSIERYSSSRSSTLHVVKSGETLGAIAKKYHTTTAALMKSNGLRRALIFPGQSLVIGGSTKKPARSAKTTAVKSAAIKAPAKKVAKGRTSTNWP